MSEVSRQGFPRIGGVTGPAGAGKDAFCDALVNAFPGEVQKIAFSDALYREVSISFQVPESLLRERASKEKPTLSLAPALSRHPQFIQFLADRKFDLEAAHSPRVILQNWGDFRRSDDAYYFVKRTHEAVLRANTPFVLISGVRPAQEIAYIRENGGFMVHLSKPGITPVSAHSIETPVPFVAGDMVIDNDGDLQDLVEKAMHFGNGLGMTERNAHRRARSMA